MNKRELPNFKSIPESSAYSIIDVLGRGGLGTAYRARRSDDEVVVLKRVEGTDGELPPYLLHEYEVLRKLKHPNIIEAYELFRMDDAVFIAMEYFTGSPLDIALPPPIKQSPNAHRRFVLVISQVFDALAFTHDRFIVHGTIAPSNILLDEDLHVKIVDFEHARYLDRDDNELWPPGVMAGIPRYMAPEQVRGESLWPSSDLYALGLIIFEWLYGRSPFKLGRSFQEIFLERLEHGIDITFLTSRGAQTTVATVLSKMLDKDPSQRPCDHMDLLAALRTAILGNPSRGRLRRFVNNLTHKIASRRDNTLGSHKYRWDVALSFAREDRPTAKSLAERLKKRNIRVFYDVDHQSKLWGADLFATLAEVYTNQAMFCAIIVSRHYSQSSWAWLESRHALRRAIEQRTPYLLPLRVDDTKMADIPESIAYIDLRATTMEQVADLIEEKVLANR